MTKPKGTDWSAYGPCPTCLVGAGRVCKHLVARRGQAGLGLDGHRALYRPHKDRPRVTTKAPTRSDRLILSDAAKAAVPEIVAYLRADAATRTPSDATSLHMAAHVLEQTAGISS